MIKRILVMMGICALLACNQERQPCLTPTTASFNIEFIHLTTDTSTAAVDTSLPSAAFVPLSPIGNKYIYFYPQQATFTLSLSAETDSCKWAFVPDSANRSLQPDGTLSQWMSLMFQDSLISQADTLTFFYQRNLTFLSNACGYTYFYTLDSAHSTSHNVDSVKISNTSVTNNVNTTQLKIYIHPDY